MICLFAMHALYLIVIILVFARVLFASPTLHDINLRKTIDTECDSATQFRCQNGACIGRCNRIVDCHDNSDEAECCSNDQFSCGQFHCIDKSQVCNGKNDCDNNKDELKCQCGLVNVHPKNSKVFVYNDVIEIEPGTMFNMNNLAIEYNCSDGYTAISESWRINYCKMSKNGTAEWAHYTFLGCSRTCPKNIFDDRRYNQWRALTDVNEKWQMCRDKNRKTINCRTEPHIFPGTTVPMVCRKNPSIQTEIKCNLNGNWTGSLPACDYPYNGISYFANSDGEGTCSTESLNKPSLKLLFSDNYKTFSTITGSGTVLVGTTVKIVCAKEYYSTRVVNTELTCNTNGEWTGDELPKCTMVCGERSGRYMVPSMLNGVETTTHIYPWVAAVYRKSASNTNYRYICSGNIISSKLIVSAAHCFTEESPSYLIGVGKNFGQFTLHYSEENMQMHSISAIKYLGAYKGDDTYYENDIIVIVLKSFINFDVHIKPICIDYETTPNEIKENLLDLEQGYIAGWRTINETNDHLIFTSHTIVDNCRLRLQNNGRLNEINYLTSDKFCAGNLHYSTVCSGDSGGGLVFEKLVKTRSRFYLYGVLSLTAENCSTASYGFYTNVQNFKDAIKNLIEKYEE